MTIQRITYRGEVWISVRDAACCFEIERSEIEGWVLAGVLPEPTEIEGRRAFHSRDLDRIARLVQYTRLLHLDLTVIRLLVERRDFDL